MAAKTTARTQGKTRAKPRMAGLGPQDEGVPDGHFALGARREDVAPSALVQELQYGLQILGRRRRLGEGEPGELDARLRDGDADQGQESSGRVPKRESRGEVFE